VLIKADVQGSGRKHWAARSRAVHRQGGTPLSKRRRRHQRGDLTLAKASGALLIGFNVRPTAGREIAKRDKVDIRTTRSSTR